MTEIPSGNRERGPKRRGFQSQDLYYLFLFGLLFHIFVLFVIFVLFPDFVVVLIEKDLKNNGHFNPTQRLFCRFACGIAV